MRTIRPRLSYIKRNHRTFKANYVVCSHVRAWPFKDCVMRTLVCISLLLVGTGPSSAQIKSSMLCKEDLAMALKRGEEDNSTSFINVAKRTFSLAINREYLSLISAGRSEFYECQKIW